MKHLIQTLRIGMALFLAIFGTSAIPAATASALEGDTVVSEEQLVQPVEPTATLEEPAVVTEPAVSLETQETLPLPPAPEESLIEEVAPVAEPVTIEEETFVQPRSTIVDEVLQLDQSVVINQTCDDVTTPGLGGWTTKFDDSAGYPNTVEYMAPAGFLVDKYCVKAGSVNQGLGPVIVLVDPPASTVTIDYPDKDSISHYVVHLIPTQAVVSPLLPQTKDECGVEDDGILLPDNTSLVTYSLLGNTVTATLVSPSTHDFGAPLNGYVVAENGLTATYTVTHQFSDEPCVEVVCPTNTEWYDQNENQVVDEGECFKKVFVCKYVGTPGIDERLQTGGNPISVSVNSIKDFQGIGSYFNDAQGRSFVLAFDEGQPEPSISECPSVENPNVMVLATVCIEEGQTGNFTVRVSNPNMYAVEYRVDVEGGKSDTKTIAGSSYADFTFTGYSAGTYDYNVYQKIAYDVTDDQEEYSFLDSRAAPQPEFAWELVYSDDVTLENCPRVLGETDVCPNLTGTQSMVPSGYTLTNGQCVTPQVLAAAVTLPATIPATGASDTSNIYLVIGMAFSALTYFAMLRRNQEAYPSI